MKSKLFASAFSMPDFDKETILASPLARSVPLSRNVDEDTRTVELSFSSDEPIYHWFGYLILDHSESSCRLERLNQTGALLWMHDRGCQIGALSNIRLENGIGRATAKFSRVGLGAEKFQDVLDEICRTTSFGFFLYDLEPEPGPDGKQRMIDGEPVYRSRDWEPFEVSLEPIPADTGVGVGRSLEVNEELLNLLKNSAQIGRETTITTERTMPDNIVETPAGQPAPAAVVANPTITRAAEAIQYGELFGAGELVRGLLLTNPEITDAEIGKAIIADRAAKQPQIIPSAPTDVAARQGQPATVISRVGNLKSFRGANAQENAYRSGMFLRAHLLKDAKAIEYCRANGVSLERDMTGTNNSTGGVLVPVEMENSIIDLRIEYGVFRSNARVVPMASDTKNQPRRTGGLTAYAVGPGQAGTESTPTYDLIELVARKWMVLAEYEKEFSDDAIISAADTLASEIAYAFTYAEDNAGFNGTGLSSTHGIVGIIAQLTAATAGLQTASGNLWSEIVEADILGVIGKLPQFARKSGNVKWYCSHTFWATVLQRLALAKGGVTLAEVQGKMQEIAFGYPVEIVEVMPLAEANSQIPLLFGNLSQAATFGDRRGVEISVADQHASNWASDILAVKGTERFDINVHDVGDTTNAGAIVGLITASS